jgi:hypothetical protein
VLAVGTAAGTVTIHDVEKGTELQRHLGAGSAVASLTWSAVSGQEAAANTMGGASSSSYQDRTANVLPELGPLPDGFTDLAGLSLDSITARCDNPLVNLF